MNNPAPTHAAGRHRFSACVHRGTRQIGGTCIELSYDGARLLLDLGLPLDAGPDADHAALMPPIPGLGSHDPSLLALVISHGHGDHWGLSHLANASLPIIIGADTRRILNAAATFVPRALPGRLLDAGYADPVLRDRESLRLGPFEITPYLVDHSAYDAYALLVEAGGRRLFYSGDLRGHGRKAALFERLLRDPPHRIDAMLMEGSSLGRLDLNAAFPREAEIEVAMAERLSMRGLVVVCASAQNIDRMVTIYRACKRTGRTLVIDLYAAEVLAATGSANVPTAGWPNLKVHVPQYQRQRIARSGRFDLLAPYRPHRIYPEGLADLLPRAAMLFRPAMMADIDALGDEAWSGAKAIWSQWDGYLREGPGAKVRSDLAERGVPLEVIHTSGHASIADLRRLSEAIRPDALVPIHTFDGDRFTSLFSNVVRRNDGEWWEV
ncbi:ribonuclease J [Methylorubrum extorquens]